MPRNLRALLCAVAFLSVPVAASAQSLQPAKPEEVGLSSQRLAKIAEVFNQEIKDQKIPGAVIMIARKGKVAYHEAFGAQDKSAERTMAKDSIFRIYSMTKPITRMASSSSRIQWRSSCPSSRTFRSARRAATAWAS